MGEKSQVLQKVHLNFVEHQTCSNLYAADASTSSLSRGIVAESQLCAGVLEGGKDTCQVCMNLFNVTFFSIIKIDHKEIFIKSFP